MYSLGPTIDPGKMFVRSEPLLRGTDSSSDRHSIKRQLVILLILAASIYGTTYQQFRHFSLSDPRGADDATSYVKMSHGDYRVSPVHRYRFIVPVVSKSLRPLIRRIVSGAGEQDKLSFYAVNFTCTLATSLIFVLMLEHLGFPIYSALIGAFIFVVSRITTLVTGTPLVDAPYFTSATTILYLALTGRVWLLSMILPLLVLVKEPLILIAFLPLLVQRFKRIGYWVSLIVSVVGVYLSRLYIDLYTDSRPIGGSRVPSLLEIVMEHVRAVGLTISHLPAVLLDLQSGFSFFLVLAIAGFFTNRRTQSMHNHSILLALIPVSILLAVVSGNLGRMLFLSFPVLIPYALVFIQDALAFPQIAQQRLDTKKPDFIP